MNFDLFLNFSKIKNINGKKIFEIHIINTIKASNQRIKESKNQRIKESKNQRIKESKNPKRSS